MSSFSDLRLLVARADTPDRGRMPAPSTLFISPVVKRTLDTMLKLKEKATDAEFLTAVVELTDLADKDDALLCMEDYQPHRFVIDFLQGHLGDTDMEKSALTLLLKQSKRSRKLRRSIRDSRHLMVAVITICERTLKEPGYNEHFDVCLTLLSSVMISGPHAPLASESKELSNFLKCQLFSGISSLIVNAAKILSNFKVKEHNLDEFVVTNASSLCDLFRKYMASETVVVNLCGFLDVSTNGFDTVKTSLISEGLPILLAESITKDNALSSAFHFGAVVTLLCTLYQGQNVIESICSSGFLKALLDGLIKFPDNEGVQTYGINIAGKILPYMSESIQDYGENWLRVIYKAMTSHRESKVLNEWCCRSLVILCMHCPFVLRFVGDDPAENQDNVHTCVLGVLLLEDLSDYAPAVIASCDALFCMASYSPNLQLQLMLKNTHIAIFCVMRRHCNNVAVLEAACRTLRSLCLYSQKNKTELYRDDILDQFYDIFERFFNNADILAEAVTTLSCLADLDAVKHQVVLEMSHKNAFNLCDVMKRFASSQPLQEAAAECLTVLASAEGATYALYTTGVLNICLQMAGTHINSYRVQKSTVIFIQLLSQEIDACDNELIENIARCIKQAMEQFKDALGIQIEGCIAIQLLAEKHFKFAEEVFNQKLYECIFELMEKASRDNEDVLNLASECIYILACERDLKTKMLNEAVKQGQLSTVQCLIDLGANGNNTCCPESPICMAIRHNAEHLAYGLVKALLTKGGGTLQKAFDVAVEMGYHRVTGLLLKHISSNSKEDDDSLYWCNLQLSNFRIEWLEEVVSRAANQDVARMSIKQLVKTILGCQETRTDRRLSYEFVTSRKLPTRYEINERRGFDEGVKVATEVGQERVKPGLPRLAGALKSLNRRRTDFVGFQSAFRFGKHTSITRTVQPAEINHNKLSITFTARRATAFGPGGKEAKYLTDGEILEDQGRFDVMNDTPDRIYYASVNGEIEEYFQTTLSGANIPFNLKDPRRGGRRKTRLKLKAPEMSQANVCIKRSLRRYLIDADRPSDNPFVLLHSPKEVPEKPKVEENMPPVSELDDATTEVTDMSTDASLTETGSRLSPYKSDVYNRPASTLPRRYSNLQRSKALMSFTPSFYSLDLSSNGMTSIEDFTKIKFNDSLQRAFAHLTRLNLSHNRLEKMPPDLWKYLSKLVHLELSDNRISSFPSDVLFCCPLESLDVSDNQIFEIDFIHEGHEHLSRVSFGLKILKLARNSLTAFPSAILNNLFGLEELNLQGNKIRELPQMSFKLKRLKALNLANNYIKYIPEEFLHDVLKLATLDLSCNELESLPSGPVVEKLCSLSTLKLAHNALAAKEPFYIPQFILKLEGLRFLDLSNNQLTGIPSPEKWFSRNLRELIFAENQIDTLVLVNVREFWGNLERLSLSHNRLKQLPPEIGRLSKLSSLDITYNAGLNSLPDELGLLVGRLWDFPTDGLKLNLDDALLKGPRKDLLGYLHNRLKKSVEYYGLKLMFVGFGCRGKTSLLKALRKERPGRDERDNLATVGVNVTLWRYPCRHRGKAVEYEFSCWDFAGQEDFYSTHQCFLSKRALYLVVYDLKKKEEELKFLEPWLLNIKAQAPKCPVIIVGTNLDSIPSRNREDVILNMRDKIRDMCTMSSFPKIADFAEVDARRDNFTVEELRSKMVHVLEEFKINGQYVMGQKIPASYVRMEECIRGVASSLPPEMPILQHRQILKIVKDAKLDLDENELQQTIRFLHDSGVLLHFDDAVQHLNNLYFVDPQWLCRMMAQVVTVRDINPFIVDGIMKTNDLKLIFSGKRIVEGKRTFVFPAQHISYYMRLLEKFEVALLENDGEILIPSRLPAEKPLLPEIEADSKTVSRLYIMNFLPTGFWPRLIARLRTLIDAIYKDPKNPTAKLSKHKIWRRGFFSFWNKETYFLIDGWYSKAENLRLLVPRTQTGMNILVQLIDCVDVLIEEWFPGLLERDMTGEPLLTRLAHCPYCGPSNPYMFDLEEIIIQSELEDEIPCPNFSENNHKERVELSLLAPDVVLNDLDSEFKLENERFELIQTQEYLLGQGGFGAVYRATYCEQACAVKVFTGGASETPVHRLLRQEVEILRRLQHPSLLRLLAVERRFIVLELAPMGSLDGLLTQKRIGGHKLQHRIALQVAEGLSFLHKSQIIYRDLKPDNVLVFSLSADRSVINVKLSDYGISRLITPYGFVLPEGTAGFQAPEVICSQVYDLSADIYSLGIVLYCIVSHGGHPFESTALEGQYNEAILMGKDPEPLYRKGCSPWPDMEDLINHCLQWTPNERPTANAVVERLQTVDFTALQQVIPITKDANVDCMSVRVNEDDHIEICTASGCDQSVQITWNDVTAGKSRGTYICDQRVLCMIVLNRLVLLGTQSGRIWVYDFIANKCLHSIERLNDSILCLVHYKTGSRNSYILAGLANGELAIFDRISLLGNENVEPVYVPVGPSPVRALCVSEGKAYICCGTAVNVIREIKEENDFFSMKQLCDLGFEEQPSDLINCIVVRYSAIFLSVWGDSRVHHYDVHGNKAINPYNIKTIIENWLGKTVKTDESRVTSLMTWSNNRFLGVGTGGGFLVVIDIIDQYHVVVGRYTGPIRALDRVSLGNRTRTEAATMDRYLRSNSEDKRTGRPHTALPFEFSSMPPSTSADGLNSCFIVSGRGFYSRHAKEDESYAYVTIWKDDIIDIHRSLQKDMEARQQLVKSHAV